MQPFLKLPVTVLDFGATPVGLPVPKAVPGRARVVPAGGAVVDLAVDGQTLGGFPGLESLRSPGRRRPARAPATGARAKACRA
ncbi:hypothetical protein T261_1618 [Streptomyces lydicus]|nr:hypothetical protein T261_1618 [Streptomyces lydicus]